MNRSSHPRMRNPARFVGAGILAHEPEVWVLIFGKDHGKRNWAKCRASPGSAELGRDSRHELGTRRGGTLKFELGCLPELSAMSLLITVFEQLTHICSVEAAGFRFRIVGIDRGQVEFPVSAFCKLVGG